MASATKTRPAFGQTVTVKAKAVRRSDYETRQGVNFRQYSQRLKKWDRWPFNTPRDALYIGYRTKFDGETEWIDEEGEVFTPTEHHELWLVVEDERRNPYFVWPDDCEVS